MAVKRKAKNLVNSQLFTFNSQNDANHDNQSVV